MIESFADQGTEDLFNGHNTRQARSSCPRELWEVAGRKLDQLDSAELLDELSVPPGNRLEALTGNRRGQHSIRINQRYRVCFNWKGHGPENVQVVDYHK